MKVGLVGFPVTGKTTVYNALTGQHAEIGYAGKGGKTNLGVVKVPDARIDALAAIYSPRKITFAEIVFVDVPAPPGVSARSLDPAAVAAMREVDALAQVVRGFPAEDGTPPDLLGEIGDLNVEMTLADLGPVEKRLERLKREKAKPGEVEVMTRIRAHLEEGKALRDMALSEADLQLVSGYRFLTLKPLLVLLNVSEGQVAAPVPDDVAQSCRERGLTVLTLSGKIEMDIAELSAEEQKGFLAELGLSEPAMGRFVRAAYAALDLISFLTAGEDECRAWTIRRGTTALKAAGKIHSDIERGFIKAEVMHFDDFVVLRSEAKMREAGKLRLEGKEYVVKDGDIVHFRHNT